MKKLDQLNKLSKLAGIEKEDLIDFMLWSLQENLLFRMRKHRNIISTIRKAPNGLAQFKDLVFKETGIQWDIENLRKYYDEVLIDQDDHYRAKIATCDIMRLIINAELKCVHCGQSPPKVMLHIDHILPVSKGGSSRFENLQFLCKSCNLSKSSKKERGALWINLKFLQLP